MSHGSHSEHDYSSASPLGRGRAVNLDPEAREEEETDLDGTYGASAEDGGADRGPAARGTGPIERTFAPLPPAHGRAFAESWWGRAWLKALEDTALDGQQLKKGRKQAREGAVGAVSVRPGRITAVVRGRDGTPYRSDVLLRELTASEWDRLLDVVADQVGHIAALLDRDMPPHLVEDAAAAGVELLPGIGDLEPECGCEAWDHCPHTAALCYQLARLLDQDPFVLLLMRGRGERELLDDLQTRTAGRAASHASERTDSAPAARTVSAREVYAGTAAPVPLPPAPPQVAEPGRPPRLGGTEAEAGGARGGTPVPDAETLEFLAAAAARLAHHLLAQATAPGHADTPVAAELSVWQDTVRLATAAPAPRVMARLVAGCGRDRAELDRAVRAWRLGGPEALAVLDEPWTPDADALARATTQLTRAWDDEAGRPRLRGEGNRWTLEDGSAQLRYGRDGRWWPFRPEDGQWSPAGPAATGPATALAGALDD